MLRAEPFGHVGSDAIPNSLIPAPFGFVEALITSIRPCTQRADVFGSRLGFEEVVGGGRWGWEGFEHAFVQTDAYAD